MSDKLTIEDIRNLADELDKHAIKDDLVLPVTNPRYLKAIDDLIKQGTITYTDKGQYRVINDTVPDGRKLTGVLMEVMTNAY